MQIKLSNIAQNHPVFGFTLVIPDISVILLRACPAQNNQLRHATIISSRTAILPARKLL
jgi:hypothetical protein